MNTYVSLVHPSSSRLGWSKPRGQESSFHRANLHRIYFIPPDTNNKPTIGWIRGHLSNVEINCLL